MSNMRVKVKTEYRPIRSKEETKAHETRVMVNSRRDVIHASD